MDTTYYVLKSVDNDGRDFFFTTDGKATPSFGRACREPSYSSASVTRDLLFKMYYNSYKLSIEDYTIVSTFPPDTKHYYESIFKRGIKIHRVDVTFTEVVGSEIDNPILAS